MKIICLIHKMHDGHNLMLNLIHLYEFEGGGIVIWSALANVCGWWYRFWNIRFRYSRILLYLIVAARAIADRPLFGAEAELLLFLYKFHQMWMWVCLCTLAGWLVDCLVGWFVHSFVPFKQIAWVYCIDNEKQSTVARATK